MSTKVLIVHAQNTVHTNNTKDMDTINIKTNLTSISANADKPRDAGSRKIDHNALPTEYNYQATSVS